MIERIFPRLEAAIRHPVFPVFLFIVISLALRENFPFSHFAMYSDPSPHPLRFVYLADGAGIPLPVLRHTGLSASRITKKFNWHKDSATEPERKRQAGEEVLRFVRNLSMKRKGRELTGPLQLIEVTVSIEGDRLVESSTPVAAIPPSSSVAL